MINADELKRLHEAWKQACARNDDPLQKDLMFLKAMELAYGMDNALPELLAVKDERDRAQRACEQMGERITALENSLREIGAAIINGATDTLWMGDQISDETIVDFICNLTGDDPSLLGTFARTALGDTP